uniref:Uncharacterized protein n=1 Tax=Rhizophora mucronata TaxID=61149 RepID=A0A2P2P4D0_RHIMU
MCSTLCIHVIICCLSLVSPFILDLCLPEIQLMILSTNASSLVAFLF